MLAVLLAMGAVGCGSGSNAYGDPDARGHEALWKLPDQPCCYKINAVHDVVDGCQRNIADSVGQFVYGNYNSVTSAFILGDQGAFGQGQIVYNSGRLTRTGDSGDPSIAGCTWNDSVDTTITMIGSGTFTASVIEQQTNIAPECGGPATDCTSSWTWYLSATGLSSPANNCQ
jgi:hypothetical protein